jgi:hypothetical protein
MKVALEARHDGGAKKGTGSERRVAKEVWKRSVELQTNQKNTQRNNREKQNRKIQLK